ncbi:MAG: prolyl oligopeptidase family serine peptidase, partial [Deltaproteobacteria bacterium]
WDFAHRWGMEITPAAAPVALSHNICPNRSCRAAQGRLLHAGAGLVGVLLFHALAGCGASNDDDAAVASPALPGGSASGDAQHPLGPAGNPGQNVPPSAASATPPARQEGQTLPATLVPGPGGAGTGAPGQTTPGASDGDPSGPAASPGPLDPILPQVQGDCPRFVSGTQTILGLSTEIVAGAPGAVPGPLLFTWHGTGGNGKQALLQLPQSVQREIVAQGGIIIAPSDNGQTREGQDVTFVLGVWYDRADLKFADQIVACAVQNHSIDPRRIYVTGCSAGGLMAGVMSLERSEYVAAAAPNSGGIVAPLFQLADPSRVPAVMSMYGGASDTVIVNFSDTTRNLTNVLKPAGALVVECNHGMGHCGAPASLHEKAWTFMKAHPFGTQPSPYANSLPGDFPSFCEIE